MKASMEKKVNIQITSRFVAGKVSTNGDAVDFFSG